VLAGTTLQLVDAVRKLHGPKSYTTPHSCWLLQGAAAVQTSVGIPYPDLKHNTVHQHQLHMTSVPCNLQINQGLTH
jgi:hypothetical protein